jgi:hypothetical protein
MTLLTVLTASLLAGPALSQSGPNDPLGINVSEDPTIQQQRGGLNDGQNGAIGTPYGWRNRETLGNGSIFDGTFLRKRNSAE